MMTVVLVALCVVGAVALVIAATASPAFLGPELTRREVEGWFGFVEEDENDEQDEERGALRETAVSKVK